MGSCAAPSAKGDDKFITTDYLQQCPFDIHFGDGELESTLTAHAFLDAAGIKLHPANLWYFQEDFPGRKIEYWIIWIYQQTLLFSYENSREVHKTFWK